MKVVIRTKEQLKNMGKTGRILINLSQDGEFKGMKYPIVYQFKQGKPGESMEHDNRDVIGYISGVKLEDGSLVGDASILTPVKNANNFDGAIDNFVISQHIHRDAIGRDTTFRGIRDGNPRVVKYRLEHFVVYNKVAKELANAAAKAEKLVEKTYNAPKEVMDFDPNAGDVLHDKIESWNKTLNDVINGKPAVPVEVPTDDQHGFEALYVATDENFEKVLSVHTVKEVNDNE